MGSSVYVASVEGYTGKSTVALGDDLSRGATVRDIINTVAITAVQARQGEVG